MFTILIHGGAGALPSNRYSSGEISDYKTALRDSLNIGFSILKDKGSALDAVTAAVMSMEDSPLFNAGRGSVLAADGRIQMDASVMCGTTSSCGGVTLVETVRNPILAARLVMEKTPHRLLGGKDAEEFAGMNGIEIADLEYFQTEKRQEQLTVAKSHGVIQLDHDGTDNSNTVGAVALDQFGRLAAATSTGGMTNKLPGRVSDASIIGAGTFANNNTLAISGTGTGDVFIQNVTCFDAHALMAYGGLSLADACTKVLGTLKESGGHGGVIALSQTGETFLGFNSGGMFRGVMDSRGREEIDIH